MLEKLRTNLQEGADKLAAITGDPGPFTNQAAVLVALTDNDSDPHILLTKRAEHLSTHSGEVSFPGGKWDPEDDHLLATALRESHEEIGLRPERVEVLAPLKARRTGRGVKVTPFVGIVPEDIQLIPSPDELDAVFSVPVSFLLRDQRVRTDLYRLQDREFWAPAYHFDGFEIWGFTAGVLVTFLNQVYQAGIEVDNPAPVRVFG
ncbi:CoA pyrophosphatase [Exilibacterium tricleocarpae]|uniref:CoA pyrophosphatase n=1 Tax=Exilibacterium tricleocarpae TaxID=2591008 RepID=A0A545SM98_9GAMM|nr:CoA pyrophosphatase [Exilibacterium tricleocarpae]TQV66130.1 CoA pyrophosphatase [Exilibacterium tricleocarpae]